MQTPIYHTAKTLMRTAYGREQLFTVCQTGVSERIAKKVYVEAYRLKLTAHVCIGLDRQTLDEIADMQTLNKLINGNNAFELTIQDL